MTVTNSPTAPTISPQGWTCANSGCWVANGTTHVCTWSYGWQVPLRLTDQEIERIARRVAELLEKT